MKKHITKLLFSGLLALGAPAFSDWDPEFIEGAELSALQNSKYQKLKDQVLNETKGSWCSAEKTNLIMDLILLTKPKVCVEIGAWTGSSVLPIASTLKFLKHGKVYAVDAWANEVAVQYWADNDPNKPWWSTVDMKAIHNTFQNMVSSWDLKKYCKEIALPADKAVENLGEIDFLHLDGDYSEQGSMKDVQLYLPKVKSGGYILLSHLFTMINGKQPKLKSFVALLDDCEIVCEIERDNAILFRKY